VAAGGLAAALSTAAGLLLAISSAVSHDLIKGRVQSGHLGEGRALAARIAMAAPSWWPPISGSIHRASRPDRGLAFGLAAASIFPALMMGIFSKRMNNAGAVCGHAGRSHRHAALHLPAQGLVLHPGHQQLHRRRSAARPIKSTSFGAIGAAGQLRGGLHRVPALVSAELRDIMTADPLMLAETTSAREAARAMAEKNISCVLVGENGVLSGIVTTGDLTARVLAEGRDPQIPLREIMTVDPASLPPGALLLDALMLMSGKGIGHLPVCEDGRAVGIVTRTNLVRHQSLSAVSLISDIARHDTYDALAATVAQVPQLLAQLVGLGVEAYRVGHMISSITDALTRRLIELAQTELGPAPVPWLWLACGSQGRREQTGVSDQDNCLILDDAYDEAHHGKWFADFARYVSDGLHACGYVYCPGDMMATNPRWRQPAKVWKSYFEGWIATPDPMAQMLASVMFDLRPIDGDSALYSGMQRRTLDLARRNSIFRAHMTANSLKHTPPLGLFRGFALIRSGEHKDTLDLKHSGVVPIVDLARLYALEGALEAGQHARPADCRARGRDAERVGRRRPDRRLRPDLQHPPRPSGQTGARGTKTRQLHGPGDPLGAGTQPPQGRLRRDQDASVGRRSRPGAVRQRSALRAPAI
jgi:CBS domain-containing protein